MQVQGLVVNLRLRGMHEAADLGLRLAQENRSAWRLFLPPWIVLCAIALCYPGSNGWVPWLLLFWSKGWFDRILLFCHSRAVFGEATGWRDLWAARRQVLFSDWLATLTWRRLSPWRAYTQPIRQLEGQRGSARRRRQALLLRGRRWPASMMHAAFAQAETALTLAPLALLAWLLPQGHGNLWQWLQEGAGSNELSIVSYALAVGLLEPFYVAAGFAMYLNRRVELEAWDVEQELRGAFAR